MATKPNLNDHVSLLFELYNRIPRLRGVTASTLQQQLSEMGVVRDIRTIQRNLDIMVKHLNVYKDTRDRPYIYHRKTLPIKTFGSRESMLLQLAESWLINSFPLGYKPVIHSIFSEIHQVKTQSNAIPKDSLQPWSDVQAQSFVKNFGGKFNSVFEQVTHGIIHHYLVFIDVDEKTFCIEPLSLWVNEGLILLIFHCSNDGYQHIEINKIQKANITTFSFNYPKEFNLNTYKKQNSLKEDNKHLPTWTNINTSTYTKNVNYKNNK